MSISLKKRTLFSGVILATSLSTMAYAQQPKEGFTVTPSLGYIHTDSDRNLSNDATYAVSVGYQTKTPWAAELTYLHSDLKHRGSSVDLDQYRVDGIYNLPEFTNAKFSPYVAAGIGNTYYTKNSSANGNNTFVNAGGGVKYAINQDVSLRADFRLTKDLTNTKFDNMTSVGVQYSFGKPASL
ncbi:porin family protein [Marinomonas sp. TI.3.20]|uniref:porin family protein n=1 Tax=Marinomonas sp. TI.3.20 TaxID=3121296 RepID=UPI00311FE550